MALRVFPTPRSKRTFGQFKEPIDAGSYILNKKAKATFCSANICTPSISVNTQGNLRLLKNSNALKYHNCMQSPSFNKGNLNVNLLTKLDLKNVTCVENINQSMNYQLFKINPPFLNYIIDPSGALFGNTYCGFKNYSSFMVYNPRNSQATPNPPIHIPVTFQPLSY
jgi:hypothetical protein